MIKITKNGKPFYGSYCKHGNVIVCNEDDLVVECDNDYTLIFNGVNNTFSIGDRCYLICSDGAEVKAGSFNDICGPAIEVKAVSNNNISVSDKCSIHCISYNKIICSDECSITCFDNNHIIAGSRCAISATYDSKISVKSNCSINIDNTGNVISYYGDCKVFAYEEFILNNVSEFTTEVRSKGNHVVSSKEELLNKAKEKLSNMSIEQLQKIIKEND